MTDNIGYDAWRGEKVEGLPRVDEVREPASVAGPLPETSAGPEKLTEDIKDSAEKAVRDGLFPGVIFDARSLDDALTLGLEVKRSITDKKDNKGNAIIEITVADGHGDKVVGYAITEKQEDYVSVRPAEIN